MNCKAAYGVNRTFGFLNTLDYFLIFFGDFGDFFGDLSNQSIHLDQPLERDWLSK